MGRRLGHDQCDSRFLDPGHFYLGGFKRNIRYRYSIHNLIVRDRGPDCKTIFSLSSRFYRNFLRSLRLRSNLLEDLLQSTALRRYPSLALRRSATTRNFRVPGCISLARATRFEPFRKTVTSDVNPLTKYVLSLYLASIGILVKVLV